MTVLARRNLFHDLLDIEREFDRMMARMPPSVPAPLTRDAWNPTCDILTRGEDLLVRVELPGVSIDDVELSVTDDILTISGERREKSETKDAQWRVRESCYGRFERRMALPEGIAADDIHAEFADGVLEVTIPKAAAVTPHEKQTIHIEAPDSEAHLGPAPSPEVPER